MKYSCIIVEDELLAQNVMEKYIQAFSVLNLVRAFSNASEALAYLNENHVDIVFLDINMPELSGIEFLKIMKGKPQVILTTAYPEYALEGYEYAVCDYLLKPIRYERFLKAVNTAIERIGKPVVTRQPAADHIFVKEDQQVYKIDFASVLYIQGMGNYLKFYLTGKKPIITRHTIAEIEEQLPEQLFLRVHKSYIVSLNAITKMAYGQLYINHVEIPIGVTYKQGVMKKIKVTDRLPPHAGSE
ncbi:MAG TPA: LytTR family DNA-binding domain-containing protein [Agriterribacter sp.]|nr:LytTR family DNA-binding domain-containing protein [Agriterribacter sp.]